MVKGKSASYPSKIQHMNLARIKCISSLFAVIYIATMSTTIIMHKYIFSYSIQWNLIITVTSGPNLAGWYIEVAFLLSGIQSQHN